MTITDERTHAAPEAMPLPLDVPAGMSDDDPWWDHELTLNDLLPLLAINRNALDARLRRGRLMPPLTRRGYRYFTTRRTYALWRHELEVRKAAELDSAAHAQLVEHLLPRAPEAVRVVVSAQLDTVAALRAQAARLTEQADELERAAHAAIGAQVGAGNAARALDRWGPRTDARPLAVLVRMALSTLDSDAHPTYWGGWEFLTPAAGHPRPECACSRGCKVCRAARRAVERSIDGLLADRAITRERRASRGRSAEYRLWLDDPAPVDYAVMDALPGLADVP